MQTVTVDIINGKALRLLKDMELLKLIHLRKERKQLAVAENFAAKYKVAMTKQPMTEIETQLSELRNEWE